MDSIETLVADDEVEWVSGLMWAAGVAGIEEQSESANRTRLIAGVPPDLTDAVIARLEPQWPVSRGVMDEDRWRDAWKPFARATRITDRLVVQPPWVQPIAHASDTVISLDPGRAWGHGAHPSTLLAARELAGMGRLDGSSVLEIGCGSGLLAMIAAIGGARSVVAIDVDPEAVAATMANAAINGVESVIDASMTPIELVGRAFGIVVANIGLRVLAELAGPIGAAVDPSGVLVLSGLLGDQVDETVAAYPTFREVSRRSIDGWSAVVLRNG